MICVIDEKGWCERHKKHHKGQELDLALADTPEGEQARLLWDKQTEIRIRLTKGRGGEVEAATTFRQTMPRRPGRCCRRTNSSQ